MAGAVRLDAGGAAPVEDLLVGEAEPAMSMLGAQEREGMRREIDDDQAAARPQTRAASRTTSSGRSA